MMTKSKLAARYDKFDLYERAVQSVEFEIHWIRRKFKKIRKRDLFNLGEDFCGSAAAAAEFCQQSHKHHAIAVDLNQEVLARAAAYRQKLKSPERLTIIHADVCAPSLLKHAPLDAILAMNFSYWIFTSREDLAKYFRHAYQRLAADGILFLDAFGGYEAFNEQREVSHHADFDYVWELKKFNPVNCHAHYAIHFEFSDQSAIKNAFEYHWRHWHLPEIKELLEAAGFINITFYFQGWDYQTASPTNRFRAATSHDADAGWVCYISAEVQK